MSYEERRNNIITLGPWTVVITGEVDPRRGVEGPVKYGKGT